MNFVVAASLSSPRLIHRKRESSGMLMNVQTSIVERQRVLAYDYIAILSFVKVF